MFRINSNSASNRSAIQKKIFGWGTTALLISNEEMDNIMKIVESLEVSDLLIKIVNKNI